MAHWPNLAFAEYEGQEEDVFAWHPVKCWNGRWVWLSAVKRRAAVVHLGLVPDGGDVFFVHSKESTK